MPLFNPVDPGLAARVTKQAWAPGNGIETFSRVGSRAAEATGLTSGRIIIAGGVVLPAGVPVTNVSFMTAATAAGTPTNQWFCLVDQSFNVLAKTVDDTNVAWASHAVKTLALSAAYTPAADKAVYLGIVVVAGTPPTLTATTFTSQVSALTPALCINYTTGLTDPASLTTPLGGTPATVVALPYAYVT